MPIIIGLTGKRGVGKTEAASALVSKGFRIAHAFDAGKAMCEAYYSYIGIDPYSIHNMVYGNLKDKPSNFLPDESTSRYFMETVGNCMATKLGPQWTLGVVLNKLLHEDPFIPIVVESVVYESDLIKSYGGKIIKITRENSSIEGIHTDEAVEGVEYDSLINNDFQSLDQFKNRVLEIVSVMMADNIMGSID